MKEFLLGMTALAILIVAEIIDTFSLQDIVLPMVWVAIKAVAAAVGILLVGLAVLALLGSSEMGRDIFSGVLLLGMVAFIVVYFVQEIRKKAKRRAQQRGESNNAA